MDFRSVEAFEEYFFKVFLNNQFVHSKQLIKHAIGEKTMEEYFNYQNLIKPKSTIDSVYMAKNNNLLLRLESMQETSPQLKAVFLFRNPLAHAASLLRQHEQFCKFQKSNPFILEYMNWLGHHEFGINHKELAFNSLSVQSQYRFDDINYWLSLWVNYYSYLISIPNKNNICIVNHEQFIQDPESVVQSIGKFIDVKIKIPPITKYEIKEYQPTEVDPTLEKKAKEIFTQLNSLNVQIVDNL